jgi:hypothetical protein
MPNPNGNPAPLVPAPAGNTRALKHGLFATRRELSPEVLAIADELMQLPHAVESDYPAALEIAKLEVLIDRLDAPLGNGVVERRGRLRALVDQAAPAKCSRS